MGRVPLRPGWLRVRAVVLAVLGALALTGITAAGGPAARGASAAPQAAGPTVAYVTNYGDGTVSVIDAVNVNVTATITVGADPEGEHLDRLGVAGLVVDNEQFHCFR